MNELEQFVTMGRMEGERDVLGHKVLFRVLDGGQRVRVLDITGGMDNLTRSFALQIETLARAIISIDGSKIEYIPDDEEKTITQQKLFDNNKKIILRWPLPVMSAFYEMYSELMDEQEEMLKELKNASASSGRGRSGKSQNRPDSQKSSESTNN